MADIRYVFPDTLGGDPSSREQLARLAGCDLVEVGPGDPVPPSLPRVLRVGSTDDEARELPRWYDRAWLEAFVGETVEFSGSVPAIAVIDPGAERNRHSDLVRAITTIRHGFLTARGAAPLVLVQNGADRAIPDGAALADFWDYLVRHAPALAPFAGIAVDVPGLYEVARSRTKDELSLVPAEALGYLRIHTRGGKPDLADAVPWKAVFALVRKTLRPCAIAPAVRDPALLEPAILFCMVNLQERAFT
jgi:hypothetical protein